MSNIIPLTPNKDIYWIGVNDYETELFEALWPLHSGVTYNSYIILDDKIAVIDTVKQNSEDLFTDKLKRLCENKTKIDYLIINHMEPDHSGAVLTLLDRNPDMVIVGTKKTMEFIKDFYGIENEKNLREVKQGDILDLGKHKLKFIQTPMVHWPETMFTYDTTDKILFTGDAFGGFGTLDGGIFDDEIDLSLFEGETRRYFSNIIGKYSKMVQKALSKIKDIEINIVAPTHGPIYRSNPKHIIELYDKWSKHETDKGVVIAYASMYRNTQVLTENITRAIAENGIEKIIVHNVSKSNASYIINDIWQYKGLILGTCTYNTQMFPYMNYLVNLLENKQLENRYIGIFGSYSWSGGGLKGLQKFVEGSKLELVGPSVEAKCHPTNEDLSVGEELGKNMADKVLNA